MTKKTFSLPDITTTTFWAVISVIGLMTIIVLCFAVGWFFMPKSSTVPSEIIVVAEQPLGQQQPIQKEIIPAPQAVAKVAPEPVKEKSPVPTSSRYPDIFEAAARGTVQDVETFIKNDVDVNVKNWEGKTLLHYAARNPNVETAMFFISHNININVRDIMHHSIPLHDAGWSNNSNVKVFEYLVSQGADVNAKNRYDKTPLHDAAQYNFNAAVVKYLASQSADVNAKCNDGGTPLQFAAGWEHSDTEVIKYLVSKGADVNTKDNEGFTALHHAARTGVEVNNIAILKYLISQRADVNAKTNDGRTPLDVANTDERRKTLRAAGAKFAKELNPR